MVLRARENTREERDPVVRNKPKDVEVRVNGNGPSISLRIGLWALLQVVALIVSLLVALRVMSADVRHLKESNSDLQRQVNVMRETQSKILSIVEGLRDDIQYYRERLDKHVENRQ